jgi:hypothetical protein
MSGLHGSGWLGLVVTSLLVVPGCNFAGLPRTFPVTGTVVYKGGEPVKGGSIEFRPIAESALRVVGQIEENGTFSLATLKDNAKAAGAPEGEYRVLIIRPLRADPRGGLPDPHRGVPPISLPKTYKVEAKDNNFKIELTEPAPHS